MKGNNVQSASLNVEHKTESENITLKNISPDSSLPIRAPLEESSTPLPNDILNTLCNQDNWTEVKGFLSAYKTEGRLKETGSCTKISDIPMDAYRILIDEQYGILAILAPKNLNDRINIKTNKLDKESNYSNCAVIVWFK